MGFAHGQPLPSVASFMDHIAPRLQDATGELANRFFILHQQDDLVAAGRLEKPYGPIRSSLGRLGDCRQKHGERGSLARLRIRSEESSALFYHSQDGGESE